MDKNTLKGQVINSLQTALALLNSSGTSCDCNTKTIKEEFEYYLRCCCKSQRGTDNQFFLKETAVASILTYCEVRLLFEYNPTKWSHIGSLYNLTDPQEVQELCSALLSDPDFRAWDTKKGQWLSAAIMYYVCFVNSRRFFRLPECQNPISERIENLPLQQIFYGAPGTGKSHEINKLTVGEEVIRTTFHPDSDYSTFVGAYKPTSTEVAMRDVTGRVIKDAQGNDVVENRIIYEFVDQAFLQSYINAWKAYADTPADGNPKKHFLVIEEINRGNCAQIFGDLFQLLDRNIGGFSEYPIKADNDMKKQLKKAFKNLTIAKASDINAYYKGKDVVKEVLNGDSLLLPDNLYIWATMNTSDQSLFPIDSAFKRRWDWKYMPINTAKENWVIRVNGTDYKWTSFLNIINEIVQEKTQSEDKQLGFYFCKAKNGVVDAETFVGKVLFYLWNDVFKDYGFDDDFFADVKLEDGSFKPLAFKSFYDVETRKVVETQAEKFLKNLKVEIVEAANSIGDQELKDDEEENESDENEDTSKLTITFPDGEKISGSTRFESYIAALKKIGLDKAEPIASSKKYKRHGCALISSTQEDAILKADNYLYVEEQGYYVVKGINARTMRNMLNWISDELELNLKVDYE